MTIRLHRGDLPDLSRYTRSVAIDTETMGLNPHRDRLCLVQLSAGDGNAHLVQMPRGPYQAPRLSATDSRRSRIWPRSSPTSSRRGSSESDSSPKTRSNSGVVR